MVNQTIIDTLHKSAIAIRDERRMAANTAVRVGNLFVDIIDALELVDGRKGVSSWEDLAGKPTTLAGYGIKDAYTKDYIDSHYLQKSVLDDMFTKVPVQTHVGEDGKEVVDKYAIRANYDFYGVGGISAYGVGDDEPPHGVETFGALTDVKDASNPTKGQVWGWDGSKFAWMDVQSGPTTVKWFDIDGRPAWLANEGTSKKTVLDWVGNAGYIKDADQSSYATRQWVEAKNYLTSQSLAGYAKEEYVVSELGISGNYVTWKKNNIQQYLTVPYATKSADVLSSAWLEDLNEPIWSTGFGITLQEYDREAQNKPVTIDNANYIINIGGDQHGANAHYGWQIAFADWDGDVYLRHAYARWDGETSTQAYDPWHRLAFADMPIEKANSLTIPRSIWGRPFDGTQNISGWIDIDGDAKLMGAYTFFGKEYGVYLSPTNDFTYLCSHQSFGHKSELARFYGDGDILVWHLGVNGKPRAGCNLDVNGTLRIGDAILEYDATNKALKMYNADGLQLNMYATGGISAYGVSGDYDSIVNLTVAERLKSKTIEVTRHADIGSLKIGNIATVEYRSGLIEFRNNWGSDTSELGYDFYGDVYAEKDLYVYETLNVDGASYLNNTYIGANGAQYKITSVRADGSNVYIAINGKEYKLANA